MKTLEKRSYLQLMKEIFKYVNNPDHIRLNGKEWGVISLLISTIICLPGSAIIGILWLINPKEDSIFSFMLLPWMLAPLVFIGVYRSNYRKPQKNDRVITPLFAGVEMDAPLSPKSGCLYTFTKKNFQFELCFQTELDKKAKSKTKSKGELIIMSMPFDCDYEGIQEFHALLDAICAYSEGKAIGSCLIIDYHVLTIKIIHKGMAPEWIKKIVDEFIYITERFKLRPATWEQYAEHMEKIKILLSEKK